MTWGQHDDNRGRRSASDGGRLSACHTGVRGHLPCVSYIDRTSCSSATSSGTCPRPSRRRFRLVRRTLCIDWWRRILATGRFVLDIGSGEMILRVGRLLPCSRPTRSGSVMIRAFAWSPPPPRGAREARDASRNPRDVSVDIGADGREIIRWIDRSIPDVTPHHLTSHPRCTLSTKLLDRSPILQTPESHRKPQHATAPFHQSKHFHT